MVTVNLDLNDYVIPSWYWTIPLTLMTLASVFTFIYLRHRSEKYLFVVIFLTIGLCFTPSLQEYFSKPDKEALSSFYTALGKKAKTCGGARKVSEEVQTWVETKVLPAPAGTTVTHKSKKVLFVALVGEAKAKIYCQKI